MSVSEWKKLADKNDPDALYNLGCMSYSDGNVKEAVDYWERAVKAGSLEAHYEIGIGHFNGVDVDGKVVLERDVQKAVNLWELSIENGYQDADTYYMLGAVYLYGQDKVESDLSLGVEHACGAVRLGKTEISEVLSYAEGLLDESQLGAGEILVLRTKLKNARDLCQNNDNIAPSR